MDACMDCVATNLASYRSSAITCHGRHGLALALATVSGYMCDFCEANIPFGSKFFSCRCVVVGLSVLRSVMLVNSSNSEHSSWLGPCHV